MEVVERVHVVARPHGRVGQRPQAERGVPGRRAGAVLRGSDDAVRPTRVVRERRAGPGAVRDERSAWPDRGADHLGHVHRAQARQVRGHDEHARTRLPRDRRVDAGVHRRDQAGAGLGHDAYAPAA